MRDTYDRLVGEMLAKVEAALPAFQAGRSVPLRTAAQIWSPVGPTDLASIGSLLDQLADRLFEIAANADLTETAKANRRTVIISAARSQIDALRADALDRASRTIATLRAASYPERPAPQDAAQEAALGGIKQDVMMVCDPLAPEPFVGDPGSVIAGLSRLLARALGDGDELTTWLLAASHFPEDYITARSGDPNLTNALTTAWADEVDVLLDQVAPAELAEARAAYAVVSNPQRGLGALPTLLGAALSGVLDDYTTWRPQAA